MSERLAISELYASLILLIITSTMGIMLYNYATETTLKYEESFIDKENQNYKQILERWSIVHVIGDSNNDEIKITVYNYGEFEFEIDEVYVNDVLVTSFNQLGNKTINSFDLKEISIKSPVSLGGGEKYTILIVSKNGVKSNYIWRN